MDPLRFAILGTGFWSRFQLAAWRELPGVQCVALYNRTRSKAEKLAATFGIPSVYEDAETLIRIEKPDFIDIITDVDTHTQFVQLAAHHRIPVICQKPLGPSLKDAQTMVKQCRDTNTPLYVHENWRWQTPLRELKKILTSANIGSPFRARIDYCNSFPVFDNQPFLKELPQFILCDIGSHILDTARFLFGEATDLYCQTKRIHPDIRGEDVATVMMTLGEGISVTCNMSYASSWEHDRFPETFVHVEGSKGAVSLGPDYTIKTTLNSQTQAVRIPPPTYPWADPAYALVHSSIVACNANLLQAIQGRGQAETSGSDNLKTVELVHACYDSAARKTAITF